MSLDHEHAAIDRIARSIYSRRHLLGLLGALPIAAAAKPKHKHGKHESDTHKAGDGKRKHGNGKDDARKRGKRKDTGEQRLGIAAVAAAASDGVIVARYGISADNGIDAYQPRQFKVGYEARDAQRDKTGVKATWKVTDAGDYAGWDVFAFGRVTGGHMADNTPQWASFTLGRAATLAYVHRGSGAPPARLAQQGWTESGTINAKIQDDRGWTGPWKVFRKRFDAGEAIVPSPSENGQSAILPWLLFAEADGTPSPAPAWPSGKAEPKPNELCPSWLHDSIKAPNSNFLTWHPPIDYGRYHCYFEHEHGSDWRHVTRDPAFAPRYLEIAKVADMAENHWGHKGYAIMLSTGHRMYVTQHFGTTGVLRANTCKQRHHLLEISLFNASGSERLAQLRFMADYGISGGCRVGDDCGIPLDPVTCPHGNEDTGITSFGHGSRQIPVAPFGVDGNGYEPWLTVLPTKLGLNGKLVANTADGIDVCDGPGCNNAVRTRHGTGTARFLTFNQSDDGAALGIKATGQENASGYFFTDPHGTEYRDPSNPGADAVRQFIKPGLDWKSSLDSDDIERGHMGGPNIARWGEPVQHVATGIAGDAEESIRHALDNDQNAAN